MCQVRMTGIICTWRLTSFKGFMCTLGEACSMEKGFVPLSGPYNRFEDPSIGELGAALAVPVAF